MHNYFWQVLVRYNKVETTWEDLKKAARSIESVKPAPVDVQKATPVIAFSVSAATSTNQNVHQTPYPSKAKSTSPKDIDVVPMTRTKSGPKCTDSAIRWDYAKMKCYNCNQLKHLSKDCPTPQQKQANGKPLGKGLAR